MEETVARPRYARRTVPVRRYRRGARDSGRLPRIIARQLLIALFLLLAAGIVKSINTPVTNFLSDKVRFVLTQNIELGSIYDFLDKTVVSLKNSIAPDSKAAPQIKAGVGEKETGGISEAASVDNRTPEESQTGVDISAEPETAVLSASYIEDTEAAAEKMLAPVSGVLSSRFGERADPFSGSLKFHEGIDIEAVKGADIKAVLGGTVEEAGSSPSYGNYVKLSHAGGFKTIYAHCSSLGVKKGAAVKPGEVIAKVGDSGASVGVHLHFEVLKDGKPVNPLEYIAFDSSEIQD